MIWRFSLLVFVLGNANCYGQGYYSARTESLTDTDVATSFTIRDITFIVRNSGLANEASKERDLSKLLPVANAVEKGLPNKAYADLIDQLLGGHHKPYLSVASAVNLGDAGFVWHITWDLFPSPGGLSGIPFEFQAYVRPDGSAVRPDLFLCDHFTSGFFSSEAPLFSTFAIDDLTPGSTKSVDQDQIRDAAVNSLNDATRDYELTRSFRFIGMKRHSYSNDLIRKPNSNGDVVVWAVKFVDKTIAEKDQRDADPFTVWVTEDMMVSEITVGHWDAKRRRIG